MANKYQYRSPIYFPRRQIFFHRRRLLVLFVALVIAVTAYIVYDILRHRNQAQPATKLPTQTIGAEKVYKTKYFQFSDPTDEWRFSPSDSTENKYSYTRYHGKEPQHALTIYVNQVPIPLNLATNRVLPVTVKDGSRLAATAVSESCGKFYKPGELPKQHEITIEGATMLCVPDSNLFTVVLAQVGGNYSIDLVRRDGSHARYVIIYQNLMFTATPATIQHIGNTFQAL